MRHIKYVDADIVKDHIPDFDHDLILYSYTVDGETIDAGHWSGRFNGKVAELADHLYEVFTTHKRHYMTTTETQQKGALAAIKKKFGTKNYGFKKTGEYVLIFDKRVYWPMLSVEPVVNVWSHVLHLVGWRQMHVAQFNIRHKKLEARFLIFDAHGPSAIEDGDKPKPGKQWKAAQAGWARIGRVARRFLKSHPKAVVVACGDTNWDDKKVWGRNWFEKELGAKTIWRVYKGDEGTHGDRRIDNAWVWAAEV